MRRASHRLLMSAMGSLSECRVLAKNPLKLPDRFQDRGDCPLMAARGWLAALRVLDVEGGTKRMIISESNGTFTAQHVTGPTHNMLRLKLSRGLSQEFAINVLPPMGNCSHTGGLSVEEIASEIEAGLAAANETFASDYMVEAAAIVENDTRQPGIYRYLTQKIVETAARARDQK